MIKDYLRKILYSNIFTRKLCQWRVKMSEWKVVAFPYLKMKLLHPKIVFLVLTPLHGNLGDHAIALAEKRLLEEMHIRYHEITDEDLNMLRHHGFLHVLNGSTIFMQGGGYLGTLWFGAEKVFRDVIQNCPKSKIVLMPNTIFYEDSAWGKEELEKSVLIYNRHKKLTLIAREKKSFEIMSQYYKKVELVPDVVLSLTGSKGMLDREGCLLCFRTDPERTMNQDYEKSVWEYAAEFFSAKVKKTDMLGAEKISVAQREAAVMDKIMQFQNARLVITDRLHAMIFCAVSGTPCIVVNSRSHKVKGTYEWINYLPYIRFVETVEQVQEWIPELSAMENCCFDNKPLQIYYDTLRNIIRENAK